MLEYLRVDDTVRLLPDGRVALVIGGVGGERALADTEDLDRPLQLVLLEEVSADSQAHP